MTRIMIANNTKALMQLAGIAQIVLVAGSMAIPRILKWRTELDKVNHLIKQMFWVYAAYILVINLCFGLVSLFAYTELLSGGTLAMCITGFISLYWTSRVFIQFFYFDRASFPTGRWYNVGEALLIALFVLLSGVYGYACLLNCKIL